MTLTAPTPARARIVVADDSALMRRLVSDVVVRNGFEVAGSARNGDEALAMCRRLHPDAMTLDLSMPGMGGIEVLRELRSAGLELPVVVVSAFSPAQGAYAVDALAEGAFDLVTKPAGPTEMKGFEQALHSRLALAVSPPRRKPISRRSPAHPAQPATSSTVDAARQVVTGRRVEKVVLIAISTGGPRALATLLPALPSPLGLGTLIVQHMPAGFTRSLADRLDRSSALTVREASGADLLDPSVVLLAPGGRHLRMEASGRTKLSDEEPVGGLRPRADLLIEDAARRYGRKLLLVVMTGMGNDGLVGARAVKRFGGRVVAEAEDTCTVYGMPRAVAQAGLTDRVAPLNSLASVIVEEVGR